MLRYQEARQEDNADIRLGIGFMNEKDYNGYDPSQRQENPPPYILQCRREQPIGRWQPLQHAHSPGRVRGAG